MPDISDKLRQALDSGGVVVAASPQLAREIERNYALSQATRGTSAWTRPIVFFWDQWLRRLGEQVLWSGYSSPTGRRQLLTEVQEQVLWERIIAGTKAAAAPTNIHSTAKLARQAWDILQKWRLPDPGTTGVPNTEQQSFSRWMNHYYRECIGNAWLDSSRVTDSLVPAIASGAVAVPEQVVLVGFDGFNPQQRGLLRTITNMGSRLSAIKTTTEVQAAFRTNMADGDAEIQGAVRWLRGLVASGSTQRAGLVIPDLDQNYLHVERILDEALLPGHSLPGVENEIERPYMIGAGRALRKQPVVVAADHILALSMGSVSMRVLSRIVRSPFLAGGISEAARRARFDVWIREQGSVDIDLRHLPEMLESFRHAIGLSTEDFTFELRIHDMLELHSDRRILTPSDWAHYFEELLSLFGWPGETRLNSIQQQARRVFDIVLREFSSLDMITGELPASEALRMFRQLLRQRVFRFESRSVPILVLNPTDAAQLKFDHLWVCGTAQPGWPATDLRPNPLIPLQWQQDIGLPSSSPQARANFRNAIATKLCSSASHVVASQVGESLVMTEDVFRNLPPIDPEGLDLAELTDYRQALIASTDMETIEDVNGPQLDPVELLDLDQQVLALQAACPFQSFARMRLDAQSPKPLRPGLLPNARITLLRMALEHVWHRIESSDVLQAALAGEHLEVQIWEIADTVLAVFERKLPVHLSRRYRSLEHARLVRLLLQWLRIETRRAPFSVVRTDAHTKVEMGGISLRAQVDRIDQVTDKGDAIISYDTEPFSVDHWLGDRPDSPVLILYALANEEPPAALLSGCVATERMALDGIQHDAGVVTHLPVYEDSEVARVSGLSWEELLQHWRNTLGKLSLEFAQGNAIVAPKYGAETCKDCGLQSLCRIGEQVAP